jgi:WD40 repeat protein
MLDLTPRRDEPPVMWYGSVPAEDVPADGVVDVAFAWNGETLFTLAGNGSVNRCDLTSRTVTTLFRVNPRGFSAFCPPRLAVSRDGCHLLATDYEQIAVWDLAAGEPRRPIDCNDGSITYPCFVADWRELYTVGVSAHWLIHWSWPGLQQLDIPDQLRDMTESPGAAVTNLLGTRLAVLSGGVIVLWDVAAGRLLLTIETEARERDEVPVAISPKGDTFVVGHDRTLRVYEVRRGRAAYSIPVEPGSVSRIAFHPEGLVFATAGASPVVTFWEAERGCRTGTRELPFREVRSIAFSVFAFAAGGDSREFAVSDLDDIGY